MSGKEKVKGNAAFNAGKFADAINHFSAAINLSPTNHVLYSNRAAAYAAIFRYSDALADAHKTISLKPDWSKGYSRLGAALFGLGNFLAAAAAYEKGLRLDPSNHALKSSLDAARARARAAALARAAAHAAAPAPARAAAPARSSGETPRSSTSSPFDDDAMLPRPSVPSTPSTSTSTPTPKKLSLNLLINKERNRVVLAESDKDFVDILFSFLTLPLGTIVRLLNKRSCLGCLDKLYESVEALADQYFQTPACKSMLLSPRNASGVQCERLSIPLDDHEHRIYYRCATSSRYNMVSSVPGVSCSCGKIVDVPFEIPDLDGGDGVDGVFVKGEKKFMISDDLQVKPVSMSASLALLNKLGVDSEDVLEKRTVEFDRLEILSLLKRSLLSLTPLTDVFLEESNIVVDAEKSVLAETTHVRETPQMATTESKRIGVKLFLSKDSDKVVYAEAAEDFVDLLFSFLTFPLGSIVKILGKRSSIGCIDNLYHSVEILSREDSYIKSINHKCMLLEPKLAPYFGCSNQLLRVDEKLSEITKACFHGAKTPNICEMNPKLKKPEDFDGGFATRMVAFMVTDEMMVTPFSPSSGISIINKLMVPISSLKEAKAVIGEAEATDLLRACLVSQTVLTDIFSPAPLVTLLEKKWCGQFPRN